VLDKLRPNKVDIAKKYPVASLALFGVYTREKQSLESDVHLLDEFNEAMS
jgi:predicted nucleotidyltransferase